eukprot:gene15036-16589_t
MVCFCRQLGQLLSFSSKIQSASQRTRTRIPHITQFTRRKSSLKILYFGSDAFSFGPLRHLVQRTKQENQEVKSNIEAIEIVTSESLIPITSKKKIKPSEFIEFAKSNNLQLHRWYKDSISELAKDFDIGIVASFGHLIPKKVIQNFNRGMINAHPSLLPRWRGAAPIIHTVLNGDTRTGVSIMDLSIGRFDMGSILLQKEIQIPDCITTEELTSKLGNLAGEMVLDVIDNFENLQEHKLAQPETSASNAPKITKDTSYVKWNSHTVEYLDRLHRAIGTKIGVHAYWKSKLVRFIDVKISDNELKKTLDSEHPTSAYQPGQTFFKKKLKTLYIKCIDGWISVSRLQVECKQPITALDFYNAYMVDRKDKTIFYDRLTYGNLLCRNPYDDGNNEIMIINRDNLCE